MGRVGRAGDSPAQVNHSGFWRQEVEGTRSKSNSFEADTTKTDGRRRERRWRWTDREEVEGDLSASTCRHSSQAEQSDGGRHSVLFVNGCDGRHVSTAGTAVSQSY